MGAAYSYSDGSMNVSQLSNIFSRYLIIYRNYRIGTMNLGEPLGYQEVLQTFARIKSIRKAYSFCWPLNIVNTIPGLIRYSKQIKDFRFSRNDGSDILLRWSSKKSDVRAENDQENTSCGNSR